MCPPCASPLPGGRYDWLGARPKDGAAMGIARATGRGAGMKLGRACAKMGAAAGAGRGSSMSIYSGSGVAMSCGLGPCVAESN